MKPSIFSSAEKKFILAMGLVLGLRELSMTMLNPFISIYGKTLTGSTPFLCGLAMGIYGLTNGIFQIPYGIWSDWVGRKPVILTGLLQLLIGMVLAGLTKNIYIFIFARALQGSGAVMAIAYSWLGDRIDNNHKGRAMGIAGTIVALGAIAAFAIGPLLYQWYSLKYMFYGCAVLICGAGILILVSIKEERSFLNKHPVKSEQAFLTSTMKELFMERVFIKLSICGFIINFIMSAMFFIVPVMIAETIGIGNMWMIFMPAIFIGILAMRINAGLLDKGHFIQRSLMAFIMLALGSAGMFFNNIYCILAVTILVLSGFMCLTSGIPSALNKTVKMRLRGTANGLLQTMTFLGFFAGSTFAGYLVGKGWIYMINIIMITLTLIGGTLVVNSTKHLNMKE
jgi:MFS family permease